MSAYAHLEAHGIWPVQGGIADQHPKFVRAVEIARGEKALIEEDMVENRGRRGGGRNTHPSATIPKIPRPKHEHATRGRDGVLRAPFRGPEQ